MFSDRGHAGTGPTLPHQPDEHADRRGAAHAIGADPAVALEIDQGPCGRRPEDAVGPAAIEPEVVETLLKGNDVVATHLGRLELERPIAEMPPRLTDRQPGLLVAIAGGAEPAL